MDGTGARPKAAERGEKLRLAYFVSHPIQYQAPLLRRIAQEPEIKLHVFFSSDHSVRGYKDEGFGVKVAWDTPLLEGYSSEFLPRVRDAGAEPSFARPLNSGIFRRLEAGGFHAVWCHGYSTANSAQAILAAGMLKIPVLLRAESTLDDRPRSGAKLALKEAFFGLLRLQVAAALAIGKANRRYWKRYMGEDFPVFSMPYAVDNLFFRQRAAAATAEREALRQQLGLARGRPIVLFASKLQARKRAGDLIEAVQRVGVALPAERTPYLLIIGDGEERAALQSRTAGDPAIRFLGFRNQSELPQFFDLCSVFVLPSVFEPWGLVVNEAMNAGRAVLLSDQVGCREDLLQEGWNGYSFPAGDVDALAGVLWRMLDRPGEAERMGANSVALIENFSFEQDVAGLREALAFCVPQAPRLFHPRPLASAVES